MKTRWALDHLRDYGMEQPSATPDALSGDSLGGFEGAVMRKIKRVHQTKVRSECYMCRKIRLGRPVTMGHWCDPCEQLFNLKVKKQLERMFSQKS